MKKFLCTTTVIHTFQAVIEAENKKEAGKIAERFNEEDDWEDLAPYDPDVELSAIEELKT